MITRKWILTISGVGFPIAANIRGTLLVFIMWMKTTWKISLRHASVSRGIRIRRTSGLFIRAKSACERSNHGTWWKESSKLKNEYTRTITLSYLFAWSLNSCVLLYFDFFFFFFFFFFFMERINFISPLSQFAINAWQRTPILRSASKAADRLRADIREAGWNQIVSHSRFDSDKSSDTKEARGMVERTRAIPRLREDIRQRNRARIRFNDWLDDSSGQLRRNQSTSQRDLVAQARTTLMFVFGLATNIRRRSLNYVIRSDDNYSASW